MTRHDARKKLFQSLGACFLAFVMILTNVLGAVEVQAAGIEAPTITKAFIGKNTISGGNLHRGKINGKNARGTIHVTLKDSSGNEKATVSVTPKSGTTWTVNLTGGVTIAEGDTITAYQEFDGQSSPVTTANAMVSLAKQNKDKLKMPQGEIWIEQTSSNIVNADEQAEAVQMLKDANPTIAKDIKSVKFSINTAEHAYYEVTYTDNSTSGKIEATGLTIKQVTEHSRGATLGSITIVDNVIKGQLSGEGPFDGIKVQIVLKLSDAVKDSYCDKGKCLVDKDTSKPVDATVDSETGEFSYTIPNPDLKIDQIVGVTVKEKNKFLNCSKTTVIAPIPKKTDVKDPRKLTAEDKKAIDAAIRTAYTVGGVSKLPNGTGEWDGVPAVIQIDDSGNVKIFSGNDVKGDWDWNNGGIFVPEKNEDGSVKLIDGAQPTAKILAKDLVKNIAPKSPAIKVDTDKGEVTITPPAYEKPGDDTDLLSYTITYKDNSGAEKNVTATRDLQTNKWSGTGVDADTGVITLSVKDIEVGGTITATAKDNGGLEGDTDKLDSDPATKTLETATVSYDANKGTGEMTGKTVNKGAKYEILSNAFKAPSDKQEFKTWEVDGKEVAPGTEITVNGDTVVKAIWKDKASPEDPSKPDAPRWNDSPGFVFPRSEAKEMEIGRHYRYLYGYEDKTVRPEGNITRAEAAALIARLAGLDMSDDSKPNFADTPSRWYNSAINIMVKMDLMFADKDGNFRPNEPITRAEFARAMYYVDKKNDTVAPFADVKGHVYEDAINQAYGNGRISGYPDGTFRPDAKIQRAEVARILNQYANRGTTLEGMAGVAKDLIQFTDITPSHWAYCEVMEAANNHEYQREKGTQAETWLRILPLDLKIAK